MDWFFENIKWIFSGIGAVVIAGFFKMMKKKSAKSHENETPNPLYKGDDIQIRANGDVVFAKDNGKAIQVKNSQVDVVGNNAEIKDGIHITNKKWNLPGKKSWEKA